jgi:WXG100 family type VII secretion target
MPDVFSSRIVVPSELEGAGAYINGVATQIEGELNALKTQLSPLLTSWSGAAQVYYEGLQQEWDIAAEGLLGPNGVLGQIASTMNLNWNNYTDCEWSNVKTWQR